MNEWLTIAAIALSVFAVPAIGVLIRRKGWLSEEADATLLNLVVRLLLPCFILHVIVGNESLTSAQNIIYPPLAGFGSIAVGLFVAWGAARLLAGPLGLDEPGKVRTFAVCVAMYNYGYIPIPLIEKLFVGEGTLGVLFVHNLGVEVALWTLCIAMLSGGSSGGWRRAINPPSVAIAVAMAINFIPLPQQLPPVAAAVATIASNCTYMLGQCAIPLGLLLVGATAADHMQDGGGVKQSLPVVTAACALRLAVIPALMIAAATLPMLSVDLQRVMVVEASMPAAVIPIVLAKHYGGDTRTALRVALGTSVVSLITIPFVLQFGIRFVGLG